MFSEHDTLIACKLWCSLKFVSSKVRAIAGCFSRHPDAVSYCSSIKKENGLSVKCPPQTLESTLKQISVPSKCLNHMRYSTRNIYMYTIYNRGSLNLKHFVAILKNIAVTKAH